MTARPTIVAAVLYEGWELLDVQGPFSILIKMAGHSPNQRFHFITVGEKTSTSKPVKETTAHQPVLVDHDFQTCPPIDVLILPGGVGSFAEAKNQTLLEFIKAQAETASWVVSVCTGSSILAEAGLLEGRKATSNKAFFNIQARYGKTVDWIHEARFVVDGKFITASGVSAGLDMAFVLGAKLFDASIVEKVVQETHYKPLSDGQDPFCKIYPRDDGWKTTLASAAFSLLSPLIIPMEVNAPSSQTTQLFANKKSVLSIVLFDGFDSLDLAAVLESFLAFKTTHLFEIVGIGAKVLIGEDGLIVRHGGDSTTGIEHHAKVIRVVCDRVVDDLIPVNDIFLEVDGIERVVYIPAVNDKNADLDSVACKNLFEALKLSQLKGKETGGSYVLGSGRAIQKKLEGVLGAENVVIGSRGWGRLGHVLVAETGLCGVVAALEIVKEVAGVQAVLEVAKSMEISGDLMPDGVTIQ
ncbi:UNVERIFIED_CONTAM: hypothetical protein HDU68_000170 [Siphonaria sp. JEL0065]|nr:hypothetical protein HDU68_000170 [Siphonaria sp. JEL0065]